LPMVCFVFFTTIKIYFLLMWPLLFLPLFNMLTKQICIVTFLRIIFSITTPF
jgi:hypothetical protein